jgi:type II secretory pathway predicted ATPase ExeA
MKPNLAALLNRLEDERFFFDAPSQMEALARMHFSWEHKLQLAILRGEAGSGKTALLRRFQLELRTQATQTFFVNANGATPEELTLRFAWELGLPTRETTTGALWLRIGRRFQELEINRTPLVVLCDDLQCATPAVQAWLSRLWEVVPAGRLPVTLVAAISADEAAQLAPCLAERVDLCIPVEPWQMEDVTSFVGSLAEPSIATIFEDDAMQRLLSISDGNPRHLRKLIRMSLLACLGCEEETVHEATLLSVSEELCGHPWEAGHSAAHYQAVFA